MGLERKEIQEWVDALVGLAQARGEITPEQGKAIDDFITAITSPITPMSLLTAYIAYESFTGSSSKVKGTPAVRKRLDKLEEDVKSLKQQLGIPVDAATTDADATS